MTLQALLAPPHPLSSKPEILASPHIFLIENHPDIADMISWVLALAGYRSSRGELSALSRFPSEDLPRLILLDISIFTESGNTRLLDVQTQCRSHGIAPPIIVLTTSPAIQREVEAIGYRTLLKPFHVQDLIQAIHEALSSSP